MKVWAIAALCLVPGAAWGQTAAFKCPKPGTVVQYEDGSVTEWMSQQANYCRIKFKARGSDEAREFDWYGPTATVSPTQANGRAWLDQTKPWTIWPMSLGKKVSARYDGASNSGTEHGSWMFAWTVDKYERITTKAGTFDTFVITRTQDAIGRSYKEKISSWYAPDPGVVVRQEDWNNQGRMNKRDAVSIKGQ